MGAIYLVRHGQASYGEADYDRLSPLGFEQGRAVAAELARREVRFTEARSGSLSRQRETAATVLDRLGGSLSAKEDDRWNEYDGEDLVARHGDGTMQSETDSRSYQFVLDDALVSWIAAGDEAGVGETWPAFRDRVRDAFEDVVAALGKGEHAVVFTSAGVIGTIAGHLLGSPETGLLKMHQVLVNGGITKVISGRRGATLLSFNEHAHFDGRDARMLTYR